ncbi:hypothetical protein GCM10009557_17970 [Virgisporangium ochraceum]|uniref:Carrier domain-containing protein n=1 Tax=Virgisporangium ochraceum TaxID=65505 RepID=A0A8J3ZYN3_9ACTN|nr:phosphopantetheine-binding protein [Virgisporangium ochraceum]GIJ72694.1 hypothetical protein Voc01_076110 [Virgisporangium ochraceum]
MAGAVAAIWSEVLGHPVDASGDPGFFAQGGTSILAIKMLYLVDERMGSMITYESFVEDPTIAGVVERLLPADGRSHRAVP